ncbi:MAG: hypothetical protein QNJ70_00285 [Xenococcaceae cyanobacterium MO_207.B15]|nr:hypothetical protein [Xenococcaceae cyanobacterium MO_207.B15]
MKDSEVISNQLSVIIYQYFSQSPTLPNSPIPQFPPGGDLIYLGIEAKRDRFCCEVSEPPQSPQSPIP